MAHNLVNLEHTMHVCKTQKANTCLHAHMLACTHTCLHAPRYNVTQKQAMYESCMWHCINTMLWTNWIHAKNAVLHAFAFPRMQASVTTCQHMQKNVCTRTTCLLYKRAYLIQRQLCGVRCGFMKGLRSMHGRWDIKNQRLKVFISNSKSAPKLF